jgi:hypothetical protein
MKQSHKLHPYPTRWCLSVSGACVSLALAACGGGGNSSDSGVNKTYLSVEAADAEGDALQYQWRVTSGVIDNRNAKEVVWTMPDGPGLHFAYVMVSDGKGGYTEQQYAVSTDALDTPAPARHPVKHTAAAVTEASGGSTRLTLVSNDKTLFTPPSGGTALRREVYLPGYQVEVVKAGATVAAFIGLSDLRGELNLPKLAAGNYSVRCTTPQSVVIDNCGAFDVGDESNAQRIYLNLPTARNLRLYGHVSLADGSVCGTQNEFFTMQSAATVQLQAADGTALTTPVSVNRFGDYALDAAVPVTAALKLQVQCEAANKTLDVPASPLTSGYSSAQAIELSYALSNSRPSVRKMVANGPEGNVRGKMVTPELGAPSNGLPGTEQFLTYKGNDTRLSACMYYRSFGATRDCDAQGNMVEPIAFDDWKREHQFAPYGAGNTQVGATYVNKMDLNLVRRMEATELSANHMAFYVCNHPGPQTQLQPEVDQVIDTALTDQKQIACVAMEWSVTPGTNGDKAFTKFLTFGPDGALLPSINLDGRGEKYMPGACVSCHGGSQYSGKFVEKGKPSANLGANFLAFDANNYLFSSANGLTEVAQSEAIFRLNELVVKTNPPAATQNLIHGWYASGSKLQDKAYVPPVWRAAAATMPGADKFYLEVVGSSCRTCHAAMRDRFDWDTGLSGQPQLLSYKGSSKICGGGADLVSNASMPNALASHDRLLTKTRTDSDLAALMRNFLGCDAPQPDPVYGKR